MKETKINHKLKQLKLEGKSKTSNYLEQPSSGDFLTTYDLPPDFYKPLGSSELSSWDNQYTILNTDKWQVPQPRPPVCVNNSPCTVCPTQDFSTSYPASLKDWDASRKISNIPLSNKQLDLTNQINFTRNSQNESNLLTGMNENSYEVKATITGDTPKAIVIDKEDNLKNKNTQKHSDKLSVIPSNKKELLVNKRGMIGGSAGWKENKNNSDDTSQDRMGLEKLVKKRDKSNSSVRSRRGRSGGRSRSRSKSRSKDGRNKKT